MVERFVECRSNQLRECRESTVMVSGPVLEDALVEQAGVGVAEPRVHGVARGGQPKMLHGLCEARIAVAGLASQLDEGRGTKGVDNPESKWRAFQPGCQGLHEYRFQEQNRPIKKPKGQFAWNTRCV